MQCTASPVQILDESKVASARYDEFYHIAELAESECPAGTSRILAVPSNATKKPLAPGCFNNPNTIPF